VHSTVHRGWLAEWSSGESGARGEPPTELAHR